MSEKKSRASDTRPKSGLRSWSADSYIWRGKKRSRSSGCSPGAREPEGQVEPLGERSTSCPRRRRERKCSCGAPGPDGAEAEGVCRRALSRRSLRQKFQDAVGQCLPLRSHSAAHRYHQHPHPPGCSCSSSAPRHLSVLLWSKRRIHVSELMQDKCPFSPKSELARCWHLVRGPAGHQRALSDTEAPLKPSVSSSTCSSAGTPLSWEDVCSPGSGGGGGSALEDWEPSCSGSGHTDYILVPDLLQIHNSSCYWGVLNRFQAEELLEGQPEGTFLLRDSAQDQFLFSVSFRRYSRSLHARIEQNGLRFSFDVRDPCMYRDPSVTGLLRHYSDPAACLFFEPLLSRPLLRTFPFPLQHLCRAVICSCTTYRGVERLPLPPQLRDYLRQYHIRSSAACAE